MSLKITHVSNVQAEGYEGLKGVKVRWVITEKDGAKNFAMRYFEMEPGAASPNHKHDYEHEIYILQGKCKVIFENKEYVAEKDYIVFIPPNKQHQMINVGDELLKLICLIPYR